MNPLSFCLSADIKNHLKEYHLKFDWVNTLFVCGFFVVALVGVPWTIVANGWNGGAWLLAFVLYWVTGLGVTMGYHRYFSHRTYDAHPIVEFFLLITASMALQNSALKWSADHRKHHSFTDTPKDPYNAKLGFWWSHVVWIFYSDEEESAARFSGATSEDRLVQEFPQCRDLVKNPLVRLQHSCSIYLGFVLSLAIPALIGWWMGDVWSYLLIAGFLRITAVHNSTFFINSLAHIWGSQTHSKRDTSCDSSVMALFSFGEGYHNYHHTYPNDYRNGTALYHFDPTKWGIKSLSWLGLAQNLRVSRAVTAETNQNSAPVVAVTPALD